MASSDDMEITPEELQQVGDLNFEGIFFKEMREAWSPAEDIDWDQDITVSAEKEKALADAATQMYYSNISQLMLCGRLLEHSNDMRTRKLALFLAFAKMRNVEAFGRYLGKAEAEAEQAPYAQEFFGRMSENEVDILLPDIGVLGGTVGYGVLDFLQDAGDPLFGDIAKQVCAQKKKNEEFLIDYLTERIAEMPDDELSAVAEQAAFYRDRSEQIVLYHGDLLETLGFDPDEVAEHVLDLTDEFYEAIGLDPDEMR